MMRRRSVVLHGVGRAAGEWHFVSHERSSVSHPGPLAVPGPRRPLPIPAAVPCGNLRPLAKNRSGDGPRRKPAQVSMKP
jgi:hypothetical protein